MISPRKEREGRLTEKRSGVWGSSSQDYLHLATILYKNSADYAKQFDGNVSPYSLAGIPLLVSTLRALLIEANRGMLGLDPDDAGMLRLTSDPNEVKFIGNKYVGVGSNLAEDFALLCEVRNEIVHPAHAPAGNKHNTPSNMIPLREKGLLQSTHDDGADFIWIAQLQSHRLFRWSFETVASIAEIVLNRHHASKSQAAVHLAGYRMYRSHDI